MTEYVVSLRNLVSGAAKEALRDVDKLRGALGGLEGAGASVGGRAGGGSRGPRDSGAAARNAAFRRLQRAQAEEERFTRYKIRLMRQETAERERAESAQLAAELKRIRAAQRAEAQAARARARTQRARAENISEGVKSGGRLVGGIVAGGISAVLGGAAAAGREGLGTASKIEQAKIRLTALLGSQEAASAELRDMVRAAGKTKFDWEDLVDASSALSASFGNTDERRYVLASISDMVSVAGEGKQTLNQVILAVNQVMGKGKLEAEEVNQIIEPLKGVVSRRDFYTEVARLMNITGKDNDDLVAKVQKRQKDGAISGRVAIQALTNVGRAKAGGGAAGSFAVKAGDTVEGQISNIKTGFGTLVAMSDSEQWPAMRALRGLLGDVAGFFSADSEAGQNLMTSIRDATTRAVPAVEFLRKSFALLTQKNHMDQLVRGVTVLGGALFFVGVGAAAVVDLVVRLAGVLVDGLVAGFTAAVRAGQWLIDQFSNLSAWATNLYTRFMSVGQAIGQGIVAGIRSVGSYVYDGISNLATGAVNTVKAKLGIQSPSRVMAQLGAYTAQGFGMGIEGGASRVMDASRLLGDAAVSGASGRTVTARSLGAAGAASGGTGINITINLPVTSAGNAAELARDAGPLLGEMLERQLSTYFGRLAAQGV